jgi:hypothetical protein
MVTGWVTIQDVRVVGKTAYEIIVTAKAKHMERPSVGETGTYESGSKWARVYIPQRHVKLETLPLNGTMGRVEVRREWVVNTDLEWS